MSTPTTIALVGAGGRMGREITRAVMNHEDLQIVQAVERAESPVAGKDLGEVAGINTLGVPIGHDLMAAFSAADVALDLSLPGATGAVVLSARTANTPLVCGTTGLTDELIQAIDSAARDIPVLYTPNLSLGIAVMTTLVEQAVKGLGDGYDIEIVETHHRKKVDAPSGTALAIAEAAARAQDLFPKDSIRLGRSGRTGIRPQSEIGVHAVRGGAVFGEHTVLMAGQHERIEITHRAESRALFAEGALRAVRFLKGKRPGRYTMADTVRGGAKR